MADQPPWVGIRWSVHCSHCGGGRGLCSWSRPSSRIAAWLDLGGATFGGFEIFFIRWREDEGTGGLRLFFFFWSRVSVWFIFIGDLRASQWKRRWMSFEFPLNSTFLASNIELTPDGKRKVRGICLEEAWNNFRRHAHPRHGLSS